MIAQVDAFNHDDEGPNRVLLRDCITSIFAKVRLQLYWPPSGVMGLVPGESVASVIISHGGG